MPEAITDTPVSKRQKDRRQPNTQTKVDKVVRLLRRKNGATLTELQKATGWQAHSVRGLLSGTVRKRMGLEVQSEPDSKGTRRYRVVAG
jgi:Protein of unknown function (DUF3489)